MLLMGRKAGAGHTEPRNKHSKQRRKASAGLTPAATDGHIHATARRIYKLLQDLWSRLALTAVFYLPTVFPLPALPYFLIQLILACNNMSDAMKAVQINAKAAWRQLSIEDVESLARIADKIHPGLPESNEVFAQRIKLFPAGCLALVSCDDGTLCGYAISHPVRYRQPPALDSLLVESTGDVDQYYIHDLAILPEFQGYGLANTCIENLLEIAKSYATTGLISVYGTATFWERYGFVPAAVMDESLRAKLLKYGEDAIFLERFNKEHRE
jgi:ribosomal protein S18 acetylase RimI-like enzyme